MQRDLRLEEFIMADLIGFLVAVYLCIRLPYKYSKNQESSNRQEKNDYLNKKSVDEMEKWRR